MTTIRTDDIITEAADRTFNALKAWQLEPYDEQKREDLLVVCRHYLNAGLTINLKPDAVIVKRKGIANV